MDLTTKCLFYFLKRQSTQSSHCEQVNNVPMLPSLGKVHPYSPTHHTGRFFLSSYISFLFLYVSTLFLLFKKKKVSSLIEKKNVHNGVSNIQFQDLDKEGTEQTSHHYRYSVTTKTKILAFFFS